MSIMTTADPEIRKAQLAIHVTSYNTATMSWLSPPYLVVL